MMVLCDAMMCNWYQQQEDIVVSWITTNVWTPKRVGGSSIAKADLFIRAFYKFFLFSVLQFILILTGTSKFSKSRTIIIFNFINLLFTGFTYTMSGPYRASSLAAPFVSASIIYIFCVTDSERKAAFTCFTIIGVFAYLNTSPESGFDVFIMQSSAFLIVNGLALGTEEFRSG